MATLADALASRDQAAALEQRARLLEAVWINGPACEALLPPALTPRGPAVCLDEYAADLALAPDGSCCVLRDRVGSHPGAALLQAPLLAVFLPALCRSLLGQSLLLPSWPVWWWCDPATRARLARGPARFRLRDGFDPDDHGIGLAALSPAERAAAQRAADTNPDRFVLTLDTPLPVKRGCLNVSLGGASVQ